MTATRVEARKAKKLPVAELIRLALINAECDRDAYAEAVGRATPEGLEATDLVRQFRAYRLRRYGKTTGETSFEGSTLVPVFSRSNK